MGRGGGPFKRQGGPSVGGPLEGRRGLFGLLPRGPPLGWVSGPPHRYRSSPPCIYGPPSPLASGGGYSSAKWGGQPNCTSNRKTTPAGKMMNKLGLFLFLIGIYGFILNKRNLILMLISLEMMLLGVTLMILLNSLSLDDSLGSIYSLYIIIIAGAESAIGLAIFVAFYRLRGTIRLNQ